VPDVRPGDESVREGRIVNDGRATGKYLLVLVAAFALWVLHILVGVLARLLS